MFPVLVHGVTEQVDENSPYTFSIETTTGFPPVPSQYQWYYNNVAISQDSTSPIVSVYPDISFTSVVVGTTVEHTPLLSLLMLMLAPSQWILYSRCVM